MTVLLIPSVTVSTPDPTTPSPSNLRQIRQFAAVELGGEGVGGFLASTATSGTTSTLIDANWPVNTTLDLAEQWQDAWLLRPNATLATDRLRLVSQYTPVGGLLAVDFNYTNAPINAEPYEIHTVVEPVTALTKSINYALQRMMVETEFSFIPIGGADWHSMAQVAPWLTNKSWVRQIGWLSGSEDRNQIWPYDRVIRGEAFEETGTVVLSHPGHVFGAQGQANNPYTIYVRAMAPAYNVCMAASYNYGVASAISTNGTTWTVTIPSSVGMTVGQLVTLSGFLPTAYNTTLVISAIPTATTFTVASILQPTVPTVFGSVTSTKRQAGLTLDTDLAPVQTQWAGWGAIVEAWRHYSQVLDTQARGRLKTNRDEAAGMFTDQSRTNSKWPKLTFRPLLVGGPRNTSYGGTPFAYRATTA